MQLLTSPDKIDFLTGRCEGMRISRRREGETPQTLGVTEFFVTPSADLDLTSPVATAYVWRGGQHGGMVVLRRATYQNGEEVAYESASNFVYQIDFLAVTRGAPAEAAASLVAYSLLATGGSRLFLVDLVHPSAVRVFEMLQFSRICEHRGRLRYGYLLETPDDAAPPKPHHDLDPEDGLARLPRQEREYHARLRDRTHFDIAELVRSGWSVYQANGNRFFFLLTFGTTSLPPQAAFRIDVFDMRDGVLVGYNDIVISRENEFALNDEAVNSFAAEMPGRAEAELADLPRLDIDRANDIRKGWPVREGIWVRLDYRRAGIGQALERIAGDICKIAFPCITTIGVIFPINNFQAYAFHRKAGARDVHDPLYCLEYPLHAAERPMISILHGL